MRGRSTRWWTTLPAFLVVAISLSGCGHAQKAVPSVSPAGDVPSGTGPVTVTRHYDYTGFTALTIDSASTVTVTRDDAYGITVAVDEQLAGDLRVELDGEVLHIGLDPAKGYQGTTLKAEVTLPSLRALEAGGASVVSVKGFTSQDPLDLRLWGAATVELIGIRAGDVSIDAFSGAALSGALEASQLRTRLTSAAEVSLDGAASSAQLQAAAAARLDLRNLSLGDADMQLTGGATGTVRVSGTLSVVANGAARLRYSGSPTIGRMQVSGGARVARAGG